MHKLFAALVIGLVVAGTPLAAPIRAAEPIRISEYFDIVRRSASTSAVCGFDVYRRIVGTFTITGFKNKDGIVIREIDGAHDATFTWFAPSKGTSYTFPFNPPVRYDYPDGGVVGARATLTVFGLVEKIPGQPGEAGMAVFPGTVVEVSPEGIPLVDTDPEPVLVVGGSGNSTPQNRCAALAGS